MNIIRYNPWELFDWRGQDNGRYLSPLRPTDNTDETFAQNGWAPAVDIQEEDERYLVRADVPGVKPEEIDITLDSGVLTIQGSRKPYSDENDNGLHRVERVSGRFSRRFRLPRTTDASTVTAKYSNGVLDVSIPKQADAQPRRIEVNLN